MAADRYVAGALFGCLPVMLNSSDVGWSQPCALPLEEALDWSTFATLADVYDLKSLGEQLECLAPQVEGSWLRGLGCAAGEGGGG